MPDQPQTEAGQLLWDRMTLPIAGDGTPISYSAAILAIEAEAREQGRQDVLDAARAIFGGVDYAALEDELRQRTPPHTAPEAHTGTEATPATGEAATGESSPKGAPKAGVSDS